MPFKMKTQYLNIEDLGALDEAVRLLLLGEVIAFPTETVYGLGACYSDKGLKTLCKIKKRDPAKPIAVCLSSYEDIRNIVKEVPDLFCILARHFLPGPLTIVFSSEKGTIGVRVPENEICQQIIKKTGPLYVTSANHSTQLDLTNPIEIYHTFNGLISSVLVSYKAFRYNIPSTVIEIQKSKSLKLLRKGPISWELITSFLTKIITP